MQIIQRPYTLIEEDPQSRRASPVVRVEKMFEQIQAKLPGAPEFILCVLPERKNSEIYGMTSFSAPISFEDPLPLILQSIFVVYVKGLGRREV